MRPVPPPQWTAGPGTMMGKDHTIFAVTDGVVKFDRSATRSRICVVPLEEVAEPAAPADTRKTRKYAKCVAARGRRARLRPASAATDAATVFCARRFPPRATLAAAGAEAR
jgi:hypothetical protein